jgi:hypothetical protein
MKRVAEDFSAFFMHIMLCIEQDQVLTSRQVQFEKHHSECRKSPVAFLAKLDHKMKHSHEFS